MSWSDPPASWSNSPPASETDSKSPCRSPTEELGMFQMTTWACLRRWVSCSCAICLARLRWRASVALICLNRVLRFFELAGRTPVAASACQRLLYSVSVRRCIAVPPLLTQSSWRHMEWTSCCLAWTWGVSRPSSRERNQGSEGSASSESRLSSTALRRVS